MFFARTSVDLILFQVVSEGEEMGPAGVTLTLTKAKVAEPLKFTTSSEGGVFTFENVLPGEYVVTASHPTWKLGVVRLNAVLKTFIYFRILRLKLA